MPILVRLLVMALVSAGLVLSGPPTAYAGLGDQPVRVLRDTNCDTRAPRVMVPLDRPADYVAFGYPESDTLFDLAENVSAGKQRYTLPRQPFGSTRQWVMVVAYKGDDTVSTSRVLTFKRPARSACVTKRIVGLDTYRSGINTVCGPESKTMYLVTVKARKGTPGYFVRAGVTTLTKRNGTVLQSDPGYIVPNKNRRLAETYLYAGRFSRVRLDPALNKARVVTSSADVELVTSVYRTCVMAYGK